jgi:two-component system sensor histidine kinase KdpD
MVGKKSRAALDRFPMSGNAGKISVIRPYLRPFLLSTAACCLTTAVAGMLLRVFDLSNVVMLFLLTVVLLAVRYGRAAGAWSAFFSVASFDFFFVPPRLSFAVSDAQYIFTFALMLVVALVTGQLAAQLRHEAQTARAGERRASTVASLAHDLSGAANADQIAAICARTIPPSFSGEVAIILADSLGHLMANAAASFVDMPTARWVYHNGQSVGLGTRPWHRAETIYLPLKAPTRIRGVMALKLGTAKFIGDPDDRQLLDACCASVAVALERIHFVEMANETLIRIKGERLRNALLASVSHDLKTPLTAIRGLAETLERTSSLPDAERLELSGAIRRQAEGLHQLVINLLDLARMQSEGVRLNKEWHDLSEIVGSALARIAPMKSSHRFVTDLAANLPLVELDATLFERVLVNLLDNAMKYTSAGTTVIIRARCNRPTIDIAVDDDGLGLPFGDPEVLFQPFARGQKETAIMGVGLGLALCRSIVTNHGGDIRAENLVPNGARFTIRLPMGTPPDIEAEITA